MRIKMKASANNTTKIQLKNKYGTYNESALHSNRRVDVQAVVELGPYIWNLHIGEIW